MLPHLSNSVFGRLPTNVEPPALCGSATLLGIVATFSISSCLRLYFTIPNVCDKLDCFMKSVSARRIVKLSSSVSVLLLLAFPLRAQITPVNLTDSYIRSLRAVYPDFNFEVMSPGQAGRGGSAPECAGATSRDFDSSCAQEESDSSASSSRRPAFPSDIRQAIPERKIDAPNGNVNNSSAVIAAHHQPPDRNLDIYYRNRTEFSLDVGWHPINVPFIYDFAVGDSYNRPPLNYTIVPIIASLRWHVTNVGWRWIFRGNMDFTFSGSITAIPRGPETHYYAFDFGIRRNFVYRSWKAVPYWEQRGGVGIIDAKEPLGVLFAQGQNLTFTYTMGAGVRYNLDSKYSFSAGLNYMHISNAYLSQPEFYNYGINVYGPMFGLNVRLGKPRHHDSE